MKSFFNNQVVVLAGTLTGFMIAVFGKVVEAFTTEPAIKQFVSNWPLAGLGVAVMFLLGSIAAQVGSLFKTTPQHAQSLAAKVFIAGVSISVVLVLVAVWFNGLTLYLLITAGAVLLLSGTVAFFISGMKVVLNQEE